MRVSAKSQSAVSAVRTADLIMYVCLARGIAVTSVASLLIALGAGTAGGEQGAIALFNGRDFEGWAIEGPPTGIVHEDGRPVWEVRNGEIVCDGRHWGFLRYDGQQFDDFLLHAEFLMGPGGNSGIGLRSRPIDLNAVQTTRPSCYAYEIQLLDDAGSEPTSYSSGSLYRYVPPRVNAMLPAGTWNTIDITCIGQRIRVVLNGQLIQDYDQASQAETKDKPLKGYVCLQNHGHPVRFRNVWVRRLPTGSAP